MREHLGAVALVAVLGSLSLVEPEPDVVVRFADPKIIESSGLVARDGDFLTVNDSGDKGRVYLVDGETGRTTGVTSWSDTATDVEAIAPATGDDVWVGDIGDNRQVRKWIEVTKVAVREGDRVGAGQTYRLAYPEGPLNAEALLVNPQTGRLYVATKMALGGNLYEAPETLDPLGVNDLQPVAGVGSIITDGAFFPDGKHLILRGYGRATVYSFPDMLAVGSLDLPDEPQGEGIAVSADGEIFVCSEGRGQPVLRVKLPADVLEKMRKTPALSATTRPTPASGVAADESDAGGSWPWFVGGMLGLGAVAAAGLFFRRRVRQ